ncbi:MAG: CDP-alcohol phosphatidyltransferase family protein [Clostridia bacterium]|nr:CDP-alcohol phosphatidyltransferase family protein [Clostridia bacterium]
MIGFYDYTTFLTYLSLLSAGFGIVTSLSGSGHPYYGMFFLLFCGLCDAFDGKVARTKANRTDKEMRFGIQIDSLSDLVAFGVLPLCIGVGLLQGNMLSFWGQVPFGRTFTVLLATVMAFYLLAGMIRLAYFNVTEEDRQKDEGGARRVYLGLPITSASIIFPTILLVQYLLKTVFQIDATFLYFLTMSLCAVAFLVKIELKKPGLRGILIMVGIGVVEIILFIVLRFVL